MRGPTPDSIKLREIGISLGRVQHLSQCVPSNFEHHGSGKHRRYTSRQIQRIVLLSALVDAHVAIPKAVMFVDHIGEDPSGLWAMSANGSVFPVSDPLDLRNQQAALVINVSRILDKAMSIWHDQR